ncbi:MFS transporter [Algibacillus agarilyticus]|uniref:MFS transporter n=1 Tax=Algibacillus agarilyticus TaxID=2234133 RepID=UPI000DCF80BB|nr:MFS transporter [Algibacillus agarilyticus]
MNPYSITAFKFATIVAFGGFIFGLDAALISGTVRYLVQDFNLTDLELGTVVSAPGFGVIFALLATGAICETIGRKKTLIIIAALYVVSAIASVIAPSYETLVAARFLGGLAFTSLSLASMYIGEIAPAHMRGKLVSMNQITIVVGLTAAYMSNYFLLELTKTDISWVADLGINDNLWRWMLGIEVLPAILWLIMLFTIPESPRWLISKNKLDEAKSTMKKLMPEHEIDAEIESVQASLNHHTANSKQSFMSRINDLLDVKVRAALMVGFIFAIVQPITGVNAILFYAPMVFEQTGVGTSAAFGQTLIIGFVSLFFTVLALLLIDKVGRRPLVIVGLLWSVASLFLCVWAFKSAVYTIEPTAVAGLISAVEGINVDSLNAIISTTYHSDIEFKQALIANQGADLVRTFESEFIQSAITINSWAVLIGIVGFIAAFHLSIGPIMWVVFSEIVPTHIRGIVIPMFALTASIVSFFIQKFFPWQLSNQGAADIFLFYGIAGGVGLILLARYLPETKNKTIEEIEVLLAKKSKRSVKNQATEQQVVEPQP